MRNRSLFVILLLVFGLALIPLGCKKKAEDTTPDPPEPAAQQTEPVAVPEPSEPPVEITEGFQREELVVEEDPEPTAAQWNEMGVLRTVFFAFDKSDLSDEARRTLRDNAAWIKAHPSYTIVIEGHSDERGTIEYNLALGQRRGQAVRDYLGSLGAGSASMRTVSYGEERPVDQGHGESAWARNRRAEFVIE